MELLEIKNYDEHRSYGIDWVTEYICYSDKDLEIDETIAELKKLGHEVYGQIKQTYNDETKELRLKAIMY